jgi:hypothetical protein
MLTINDRLDKLAAARVDFTDRGMLLGPSARALSPAPEPPPLQQPVDPDDDDEGYIDTRDILGEVKLAKTPGKIYLTLIFHLYLNAFSAWLSS